MNIKQFLKPNWKKILILIIIFLIIGFFVNPSSFIGIYLLIVIFATQIIGFYAFLSILPGFLLGLFMGRKYGHKYAGVSALIMGFIIFPILVIGITGNFRLNYYIYEVPIEYKVYGEQGLEDSDIRIVLPQHATSVTEKDIFVGSFSIKQSSKIDYWGKYNAYIRYLFFFRPFDAYAIFWSSKTSAKGYENGIEYTKFSIDSKSGKNYIVPIKMKDGSIVKYKIYVEMGEGKFVKLKYVPFTL